MPVIYRPNDNRAKALSYQNFHLGLDPYVAPVLDAGHLNDDVYFPEQSLPGQPTKQAQPG